MALKLEFCNVIVPAERIRENLSDAAFETQFSIITGTTWHDGYLFREGCMNEYDLGMILGEWESKGFQLLTTIASRKHWKDDKNPQI